MIDSKNLFAYEWVSIPVWVFDMRLLRITWVNQTALEFWGASSIADLRQRSFDDTTPDALRRLEKVRKAALEGKCVEEQWTLYPLGHPKHVVLQSNVVCAEDGNTDGILFLANNLKALPLAELRGVQVLRYTPILVALYSFDGAVLFRNPAASAAWDSIQGDNALEATFADPHLCERVIDIVKRGEHFREDCLMNSSSGQRYYAVDCRSVADPESGLPAIEMSARDITDLRQLQSERDALLLERLAREQKKLENAQADAREAKRNTLMALKMFVATASHELRTPLQSIMTWIEVLSDEPGQLGDCMPYLREANDHIAEIANAMVDFVRADRGPAAQPVRLHAEQLFRRTLAAQARLAESKGLAFTLDTEGLDEHIQLEEARLRQVVTNLVGNAIKYTERGTVRVGVSLHGGSTGQATLRLSVVDTGIGMPKSSVSKLMQAFVRGRQSESIDPQGLGLGLAIVQAHLTEMGGNLEVDSKPGQGTSVTVTVPCVLMPA